MGKSIGFLGPCVTFQSRLKKRKEERDSFDVMTTGADGDDQQRGGGGGPFVTEKCQNRLHSNTSFDKGREGGSVSNH